MRLNTVSPKLEKIILIIFFCFIAIGMVWQVVALSKSVPFHDWDEAIYAQVAREWAASPSLTLHYNGVVWFEKPPIPFILMGAVFALLGSSTTTVLIVRFISVVLGVASIWCVYTITRRLTKRTIIGLLAASMFVTSRYFLDRSSIVNVDIYLTLGWLLYLMSEHLGIRLIAILIAVGSKSLLGFIPLLVDLTFELLTRGLNLRKIRDYVIQIAIGSIWYIVMFAKFGWLFIQSHFLDHMIARIIRPIELHSGDKLFYLAKLWQDQGILLTLALLGAVVLVWKLIKQYRTISKDQEDATLRLGFSLIIIPTLYLVLLTVGKAKLHWYIMPIIPFVSILAALSIQNIQNTHRLLKALPVFALGCYLLFYSYHILAQDFTKYLVPDKTKLARCVYETSLIKSTPIIYLVSPQERIDAQVIEAANLQIGSSFIYGSAPSFVFYSQRPVVFYYSPTRLKEDLHAGKLINSLIFIIHEQDLSGDVLTSVAAMWREDDLQSSCTYGPWRAFIRDN